MTWRRISSRDGSNQNKVRDEKVKAAEKGRVKRVVAVLSKADGRTTRELSSSGRSNVDGPGSQENIVLISTLTFLTKLFDDSQVRVSLSTEVL